MIKLKDDVQAGVVKKRYILGRRDENEEGVLHIGRYLALDRSSGSHVAIDALKPHAILICGKRGYGKSYTMGAIAEGMVDLPKDIAKNISVIMLDTMGIYWTMKYPNQKERDLLGKWDIKPKSLDVKITFLFSIKEK